MLLPAFSVLWGLLAAHQAEPHCSNPISSSSALHDPLAGPDKGFCLVAPPGLAFLEVPMPAKGVGGPPVPGEFPSDYNIFLRSPYLEQE